ncbi:MAG: hypothetical protein ACYC0V_17550 [Armatimonadota bacterium]
MPRCFGRSSAGAGCMVEAGFGNRITEATKRAPARACPSIQSAEGGSLRVGGLGVT